MMVVFRGYLVIFEGDDESGYSAHCPDLPGVAAAGPTAGETQQLMLEAVDDHIAMLQKTGQPVPKPGSTAA